jgi:uncharacterized RDD family membrane protein YckC
MIPPTSPSPSGPAGVGRRLAARLVDGLVLVVPVMAITVPISGGFLIGAGNTGTDQVAATFFAVFFCYCYFVGCEALGGATPGKRFLRLQVHSTVGGGRPSITQAAQRHAFMFAAAIPGNPGGILTLVVGVAVAVTVAVDPLRRGIHDRRAAVLVARH